MNIWEAIPAAPLASLYISAFMVCSAVVIYWTWIVLYRLYFSPLSSIPGPWYAAISDFWMTTHVLRLRRCRGIDEVLQKYGPIVRIKPNTVIFNDAAAHKVVYGVRSKLRKSTYYKSFLLNNADHAMTVLDHSEHALFKKGYAPHYTQANLHSYQPEFHEFSLNLVDLLALSNQRATGPIDALLLFRHFFIDINGQHMFHYKMDSLQAWKRHILENDAPDPISTATADFPKRGTLYGALPKWLWSVLEYIPVDRWQRLCNSSALLSTFARARLDEIRRSQRGDESDGQKNSLLERLSTQIHSPDKPIPDDEIIIAEIVGHLIAGTDTTSTTLSYICWELSRRRDIMVRLQAELDACMPDSRQIPDIHVLQGLPYLTAVIKEGLRVYTAVPSPLERIVAANSETSLNILGHDIPAGTVIAAQSWTSHRDPAVFFSPNMFIPDRWLLESYAIAIEATLGRETKRSVAYTQERMAAHMFPFGYGSRVCGGQNLALMMLRIVLAAVARNFDIVAPPETNEESMDMRDMFAMCPAAMECKLFFIPRSQ